MELFRLVAMLLVLIVHATFLALGVPTHEDAIQSPISTLTIFFSQSISTICVDSFVLLSGWFGINLRWNKLFSFIFQVFFFSILIFFLLLAYLPNQHLNINTLGAVLLVQSGDYWFAKAYIGLMLIAPALNLLVEHTTRRQLRNLLIAWFAFQTIYGWLSIDGASWVGGGYSAASFAGLYLLARYIRLYPTKCCQWNCSKNLICVFSIAIFITILAYFVTFLGLPICGRLFTNTNPLIIVEALYLLLAFSKMTIKSKTINWIASSSFAIYLLHANSLFLRPHYGRIIREWYQNEGTVLFLIYTLSFMLLLSVIAVLVDKFRMRLWSILYGNKTSCEDIVS